MAWDDPVTERQKTCIRAMMRRLGMRRMDTIMCTRREASALIEKLDRKINVNIARGRR